MGGANAGSVASNAAIEYIKDYIFRKIHEIHLEREAIENLIREAMFGANNFVYFSNSII